jgi:hypothetical protein
VGYTARTPRAALFGTGDEFSSSESDPAAPRAPGLRPRLAGGIGGAGGR